MFRNDSLADGKAYAAPRILAPGKQSLEDPKYLVVILWLNPQPIILNKEGPLLPVFPGANMDFWRFDTAEFQGIPHQILKKLCQICLIGGQNRQGIYGDASKA